MSVRYALIAVAMALSAGAAVASESVKVVPVASAPLHLTTCRNNGIHRESSIENNTNRELRSFSVEWSAVDANAKFLGGGELEYRLDKPLAPGESGVYFEDVSTKQLGIQAHSAAHFRCRLASAAFDSGKKWSRGQRWTEPRVAHAKAPASVAAAPVAPDEPGPAGKLGTSVESGGVTIPQVAPSTVALKLEKVWGDNLPTGIYVHATLSLHGGSEDQLVDSTRFAVIVNLTSVGRRVYAGLNGPAPTYQKMNAFGQMFDAFTVAPVEDLGSIGSLNIPAGADVRVTVTFVIGGLLANNDIRVALLR